MVAPPTEPGYSPLRIGGVAGGTVLFAPFTYYALGRTGELAGDAVGIATSTGGPTAVGPLVAAVVIAASLAALSIYGTDWIETDRVSSLLLRTVPLALGLLAGGVVAAELFAGAIRWGLSESSPLVTGLGLAGLAALGWVGVRAAAAFGSGYREAA